MCGRRPLLRRNISKSQYGWLVGQLACVFFFWAADWPDASTLYPVAYPEVACAESYTVVVMAHSYSACFRRAVVMGVDMARGASMG